MQGDEERRVTAKGRYLREAYGAIGRKPVESLKVEREERSKATHPFGFTQGHESFDFAQDRPSTSSGP